MTAGVGNLLMSIEIKETRARNVIVTVLIATVIG
jgi:hypothetical protein